MDAIDVFFAVAFLAIIVAVVVVIVMSDSSASLAVMRLVMPGDVDDVTDADIEAVRELVARKAGALPKDVNVRVTSGSIVIDVEVRTKDPGAVVFEIERCRRR